MRDLNNPDKVSRLKILDISNTVNSLIADLGSKNKTIRSKAHQSLATLEEPAVKPLIKALASANNNIRREAGKILDEMQQDWINHADESMITALVNNLGSQDGFVRIKTRQYLVKIGRRTIPDLIKVLKSGDTITKWESAKALEQIGDPLAVSALIQALEDPVFDIRWLAAEGLITIGRPAIIPLLHRLIEQPDSEWLREGAHHVFYCSKDSVLRLLLQPVTRALAGVEASLIIPLEAEKVLNMIAEKNDSNFQSMSRSSDKQSL